MPGTGDSVLMSQIHAKELETILAGSDVMKHIDAVGPILKRFKRSKSMDMEEVVDMEEEVMEAVDMEEEVMEEVDMEEEEEEEVVVDMEEEVMEEVDMEEEEEEEVMEEVDMEEEVMEEVDMEEEEEEVMEVVDMEEEAMEEVDMEEEEEEDITRRNSNTKNFKNTYKLLGIQIKALTFLHYCLKHLLYILYFHTMCKLTTNLYVKFST